MDEEKYYVPNRRGTNSFKWDGIKLKYGTDDLLPLWVADMDFRAPDCVNDALRKMANFGVFGYYKSPESYFESIISWEKRRHGYEIKREWLRYSAGVVTGLYWFVQILTNPGNSCIIQTPCYYPFMEAIKDNGRNLICCDLVNNEGRYTIDFNRFEEKISKNDVKLFILCSPHNPVGRVWKHDEMKKLLEICKKHNVFVISDEIHQDIVMNGHKNIPAATVGDYDEMMVTLSSASKTFNLAGLKNAFVVIPNESIRKRFDQYIRTIEVLNKGSMFGYAATEAAYNMGETWLRDILEIIEGNFEYLCHALSSELPESIVTPLEGTYLAWINLGAYIPHEDIQGFIQEKCKLAVDYGDWFFENGFDSHIRINLATSRTNIEIAARNIIREIKNL